jgi:cation diffusion facilitator CzcD-associated flavoprotein CzcO
MVLPICCRMNCRFNDHIECSLRYSVAATKQAESNEFAFSNKYCIIGAGASGLAVAKNFAAAGLPFDVLEREADIGGLWNIATPTGMVYETAHLVSAKHSTGWEDYPMDDLAFPEYPSHARVLGYFRDYISHFGLAPYIQTAKTVASVNRTAEGLWAVAIDGEAAPRLYKGVVLANGHHNAPRVPTYPGTFAGEIMHSSAYKSPKQLRDKRVLVVGAGNSACDIARDAAHSNGTPVFMSMRRGHWFVPKFMLGFPTHDVLSIFESVPMPNLVRRHATEAILWLLQGPPGRYKLPAPEHHIDQAHPTMSDDIPRLSAHGRLIAKPEIERYDGRDVVFKDGSREQVDLIVFGTGYRITFPFLDDSIVNDAHGRPNFSMFAFHRQYDNLFAAGLVQANGSIWRLADYQGALIARFIHAQDLDPGKAHWFRAERDAATGAAAGQFVASDRHILETNYYVYRRQLKRLIRKFGRMPVRIATPDFSRGRTVPQPAAQQERQREAAE